MLQSRDYLWDAEIVAIREDVPGVAPACVMDSVPGYVPSPQIVAAYVPSHKVVPEVAPVYESVAWYAPPPVSVAICCIYLKDCTYP